MWASVQTHEEGDVNAKITAYACTKECWIGMGQDASYVPPAHDPSAAALVVAAVHPPVSDASDNVVPGSVNTSLPEKGLPGSG